MPLFLHSWFEVCPKFSLSMTEDEFYGYAGVPLPEIVRSMHRKQLGSEASDTFVAQFLEAKQKAHAGTEGKLGSPKPIACVVELARQAERDGLPMCVATSGLRMHVEAHLAAAGLGDLFSAAKGNIVCAADVPAGKPAPDIFIEAARRIGVEPCACRAYEDGESGLQAAHAAGCQVIDVTSMEGYPSCDGLRRAKEAAARTRGWLGAASPGWSPRRKAGAAAVLAAASAAAISYDRRCMVFLGFALLFALKLYTAVQKTEAKLRRKGRAKAKKLKAQ